MTTPRNPRKSFHLDIQASLARLAHIDAMLADLDRNQADGEALTARVIAAGAKVTRSELIATCQRLCLGLPPDDLVPLPVLDCESISATQKILNAIVGARCELRAIAKSNARIAALLERSVLSEGEPIRTEDSLNRSWPEDLADALGLSEATSSKCPCGGRTITHNLIGSPTPRWICEKCGASGDDDRASSRSTDAALSATLAAHLACQALTARGAEYPKASGPLSGPRKQK